MNSVRFIAAGILAALSAGIASADVPVYKAEVVDTFPHDPAAFTQGLVFADGVFYESTGLNGYSTLRKVIPETGAVIQKI